MTAPVGVQLYSVREKLKEDFEGTMAKIADIGYAGVETYDFSDLITPTQAKKIFDDLGLSVISSHIGLPLGKDKQRVLETLAVFECIHLVSPSVDRDFYQSEDKMRGLAKTFNQASAVAADHGMRFSIHNHEFEYAIVNGVPAIYTLDKYLDPSIYFQVDTYWVQVAGQDPVSVVSKYGARAPLLHIKDGPATKDADMTALGEGVIDVPSIIQAGEPHTEWLIVELDRCATDMIEALEKSYQYLVDLK